MRDTPRPKIKDGSSTTTRDLYVHLDMPDVLADLAVIEGRA